MYEDDLRIMDCEVIQNGFSKKRMSLPVAIKKHELKGIDLKRKLEL